MAGIFLQYIDPRQKLRTNSNKQKIASRVIPLHCIERVHAELVRRSEKVGGAGVTSAMKGRACITVDPRVSARGTEGSRMQLVSGARAANCLLSIDLAVGRDI